MTTARTVIMPDSQIPSGPGTLDVATLSVMSREAFAAALEGIFEHTDWVARQAWEQRPFASVEVLLEALVSVLHAAPSEAKLALIRAHPELAGRAAIAATLTEASVSEQTGAGLTACTPEEFARLQELNATYNARFGFPFILAVRGLDRQTIIAEFSRRVLCSHEQEYAEALKQISRIAALRLAQRCSGTGSSASQ